MITLTAYDLLKLAMKTAGVLAVGQTPLNEDMNDCFIILNGMLAQFNQNRFMIWHLVDVSKVATGAISYTVGTGGDFDVYRPDRLEFAYLRLIQFQPAGSGPVDIPLTNLNSMEEYASLRIKQLNAFPVATFYDPTLPLGTLYVWPIPSSQYEVHILVKEHLKQFDTIDDQINLPPEYLEALYYSLAGRIQIAYNMPVNPGVVALAKAAVNTVKIANHRVPNLMMPAGLSRVGTGWPMHGVGGIVEGTFTLNSTTLG